MSMQIVEILIT